MVKSFDMKKRILAIETSCDETAASLVQAEENKEDWQIEILSNIVASQIDIHRKYGGVFPELASRAHLETLIPVLEQSLPTARIENTEYRIKKNPLNSKFSTLNSVTAIAVTQGPGLIGSLLMGVETANILSKLFKKPLVAVNHLEGHIYSAFADQEKFSIPKKGIFPILALVVSGGHTSLVLMKEHLKYEVIGQSIDDAAGEAFDKIAKILSLGYPGGPVIEELAKKGNQNAIDFPVAMPKSLDFSFSGLKTAVLYKTKNPATGKKLKFKPADLAASFQKAVVDALILKTQNAIEKYQPKTIILSGGVSANGYLRDRFQKEIAARQILIPPKNLSTDNAVGIAIAGALKSSSFNLGKADPNLKLG